MKIVSAAEMRAIDRATSERFGVPSLTLMENAGSAVAEFVTVRYPAARRIGVICGKGNNGGDGFVAARRLHSAGREVRVLLLAQPADLRGDAAEMFSKLPVKPVLALSAEELDSAPSREILGSEILLDAVLGTGFRPPADGVYAAAIAAMNARLEPIVSVDIPSGADADGMGEQAGTVVRSHGIVTFTAPRPVHVFGLLTEGPVVVAPIGSPEDAVTSALQLNLITPQDFASFVAPRRAESHKGSFGHVLAVGGSVGKAGSVAMAGMAALRAGAGLATVATPKSVLPTVAGFHPEVMTEPLEETEVGSISKRTLSYGHMDAIAKDKTVLAIGPGISRQRETAEFVRTIVKKYKTPMVLDADGLNAFETQAEELDGKGRTLVITPHPGEMARLLGSTVALVQRDRLNVARTFARDHSLTVVLKGHRTLVAAPDGTVWVNTTGNPGMATGGTGDVLTGMVAGLIAQNPGHPQEAVTAAVYLHGLAGDVARETMGEHSLTATDLLKTLPAAFHRARTAAIAKIIEF